MEGKAVRLGTLDGGVEHLAADHVMLDAHHGFSSNRGRLVITETVCDAVAEQPFLSYTVTLMSLLPDVENRALKLLPVRHWGRPVLSLPKELWTSIVPVTVAVAATLMPRAVGFWICTVNAGGAGQRFAGAGLSLHLSVLLPSKAGILTAESPILIDVPSGV